jgi:hypothetical protein
MISQEDIIKHIRKQIIVGWVTSASGKRGPYVQTFDIVLYQDKWYIVQKYRLNHKAVWQTLVSSMETAAVECGIGLHRSVTAGGMLWKIRMNNQRAQDVMPAFMAKTKENWSQNGCPRSKMNLRHHDRMLWAHSWKDAA